MSTLEATRVTLKDLVLASLEGDEADPRRIAAEVAQLAPEEMLREFLAETLHHYVRSLSRMRARRPDPSQNGSGSSAKWSRVEENREAIELLRERVYARGEWKLLGDCDATDCLDMARARERQAELNAGRAKRLRVLAGALKQRKVQTVRELPADALEGILNA